jgi:hypothetical protein
LSVHAPTIDAGATVDACAVGVCARPMEMEATATVTNVTKNILLMKSIMAKRAAPRV